MGFPILESLFGKLGILYGSIYVCTSNLFLWTFGEMLFSGSYDMKAIKNALLNPGIISIGVGILLFLSPVKLPFFIKKSIDMVGSLTTPLAMIIIGSMLAEIRLKEIFSGTYVYYGTIVRLLVFPMIILIILKTLGIHGIVLGTCCIVTAMPAAANVVMFAEKYNGDSVLASKIVVLSTAMSIITIPIMVMIV